MSRYGPEEFRRDSGVSRETLARLEVYAGLLRKWNARINLVSPKSLDELWRRHFWDSAQLFPLLPALSGRQRRLLDLGSGAGFPGLVLAIIGAGETHLVEADQRKAAFLREVARESGCAVTIHASRIEQLSPFTVDVITARALAPLPKLLAYAEPFCGPTTLCLFLKGVGAEQELTAARKDWKMRTRTVSSRSDSRGEILVIEAMHRGIS